MKTVTSKTPGIAVNNACGKYKINFQPCMPVEINLSLEGLASLVGTARENIVRISSDFKGEGILETKGRKIVVLGLKRLIEVANNE